MASDLDKIFDAFCTKKERKQGRQTSLTCTEPPTYSPNEEIIKQDELNNKVIIYTATYWTTE